MVKTLRILVLSAVVFLICGAPTIKFQVLRPAPINVPNYIQSLGVIDRSSRPKTVGTVIEKVLTAELPGEGKVASQFAIDGFANYLHDSKRFVIVRSGITLTKETQANLFPEPLSWATIDSMCNKLNVDALVSLEIFNSDYIIPTNMVIVTVGFRLYDPIEKRIFDQDQIRHEFFLGMQVSSGLQAIGKLIDKDRAVKDASFQAGARYGERISPSWYYVQREYYRKPKRNSYMSMGSRMMEVNDWNAAIENLNRAVETGNRKTRGRAAHNLAVVYEILGDLEGAKNWAQSAWGMYRNKGSKNYSFILGQRMKEQRVLEYQEKE